MPHYSDGTEAAPGDVVRGTGYNVKGEITGTVIYVNTTSDVCNVQVAYLVSREYDARTLGFPTTGFYTADGLLWETKLEYGQADAFVKV